MRVPQRLFWLEHPTPIVHAFDESVGENLESTRHFCVCLHGRHSGTCSLGQSFGQGPLRGGGYSFAGRLQNKYKKVVPLSLQANTTFGHAFGFRTGNVGSSSLQVEKHSEGVGKIGHSPDPHLSKVASILGQVRSYLVALPFL